MLRGRFEGLPTTKTCADRRARARLAAFELLEELSLSEGFVGKRNRVVAVETSRAELIRSVFDRGHERTVGEVAEAVGA